MKLNRKFHIRRKGRGKGKLRHNPSFSSRRFLHCSVEKLGKPSSVSQRVYLENHSMENVGGRYVQHHKFYEIALIPSSRGHFVKKRWGKVGQDGQEQVIGPYTVNHAERLMNEIENSKRSRGYF